ncbi:MAG: hypothetical protein K2P12_04875 [Clostridia bacterium]|nr:hypothetical protein [Clostridia bacterium]
MRFARLAFQYLRKNFWYLAIVTLIPSVILGLFTEPCSMIAFFAGFNQNQLVTFGDVFLSISELNWKTLVAGIFAVPIISVFLSMVCGLESKHMRWGILSREGLIKRVNNNFLPVFKLIIVFLLTMECYAVICSLFTFLWVKVIHKAAVALALTITFNVMFFIVMLFIMVLLSLTLPIMSITGLNLRKAIAESTTLLKGRFFRMLFAVVVPMLIPYAIMATLAVFGFWWRVFINVILLIFVFSYYITLMYTTYLDIEDIDREDLKNKYLKLVEG